MKLCVFIWLVGNPLATCLRDLVVGDRFHIKELVQK